MSEPANDLGVEDIPGKRGESRQWRQHLLFWPTVLGIVYTLTALGVMAIEVFSEFSKLSRGFYTDTFSPFFYTHVLTFPTSTVHSDWPGYPEVFDEAQWKSIVWHAIGSVALTVVIQAVLLAAVVLLVVWLSRRIERRSLPA